MNNRRKLVVALGVGALAWTRALRAQAVAKVPRIGVLVVSSSEAWEQAFRLGLRDRGWVEGKNFSIEQLSGEGKLERLPELAAELVRSKVDVIVAAGTTVALAVQKVTKTIPVVW